MPTLWLPRPGARRKGGREAAYPYGRVRVTGLFG